jgi:hypothetical protein
MTQQIKTSASPETPTARELTPVKDRPPLRLDPNIPVPIMIEITKEDRQNAGHFTEINNCLICTALHRMGYDGRISVDPTSVDIGKKRYEGQLYARELCWDGYNYGKEVVGKQFILYPEAP